MKLGVCYYPEHWPPERWPLDARLMREAGLDYVRIGEFAWQQMEPAENQFAWNWLDRAIDTLAAEGLHLILGTPTAAPPAWLCRADPDILPVDAQGRRRRFGSRRHYCVNAPAYWRHTERIVSAMAARYGRHPAVVGWQIDNEFGCHDTARCYCEHCAVAFRRWLQNQYGALDALNDAWGNAFWSQNYAAWDEIDPPNLTIAEPNPSHVLDYYRFSSDSIFAYQQLQIDLLRRACPPNTQITTNFMGRFADLDYTAHARPLDFVCWDSYPTGYAEILADDLYQAGETRPTFAFDVGDPYVTGYCHDLMRGLKQAPFWVMEQQAGHINWARVNPGVRPGAVRLWTWHALASGADAVVYFRWRAVRFAQEQHHSGLRNHDASPGIGYQDVLSMLPERQLMARVVAEPSTDQVALLHDYQDLWALELQPHNRSFDYSRQFFTWYRALQRLGIPTDIVPPTADLSRYRLVIAPTRFMADADLAERLTKFATAGGTVLLGVRSGFKTPTNLVTDAPLPGPFRDLVGATVVAWHSLPPGIGYPLTSTLPDLSGPTTLWAEALHPDPGTTVLAQFTDWPFDCAQGRPFAGQAALTSRPVGQGRALYIGFWPTLPQAEAIAAALAFEVGVQRLADLPAEGVIVQRRGPYTLLLNFTESTQIARVADQNVSIPPRDVRILSSQD